MSYKVPQEPIGIEIQCEEDETYQGSTLIKGCREEKCSACLFCLDKNKTSVTA